MNQTSHVKVYLLQEYVTTQHILKHLKKHSCSKYKSIQLNSDSLITEAENLIDIKGFVNNTKEDYPEWFQMLEPYLQDSKQIGKKKRSDLILLFTFKTDSSDLTRTYLVAGGLGAVHIQNFLDPQFGLNILGRIFEPERNSIGNVDEKAIIGDILASVRYYRHPRRLDQEDDFGKILKRLSVTLYDDQIKDNFNSLYDYKKKNDDLKLTVEGSSFFDCKAKIPFRTLLQFIKEINLLLDSSPKTLFNQSLRQIDNRKEKALVKILGIQLLGKIKAFCENINSEETDISVCPDNFTNFFSSSAGKLISNAATVQQFDSLDVLQNLSIIKDAYQEFSQKNPSVTDDIKLLWFADLEIQTYQDIPDNPLTSGKLEKYCNTEVFYSNQTYFLISGNWYEILTGFDSSLTEKYENKILKHSKIAKYPFIPKWEKGESEGKFNDSFSKNPISKTTNIVVHPLKTNHIEICDVMHIDHESKTVYFIFAKKGLNASVRDLVSQVSISARIIQMEAKSKDQTNMNNFYQTLTKNKKIVKKPTKESFRSFFTQYSHKYVLVIQDEDCSTKLNSGIFRSRIAKYSLIEFATFMDTNEMDFSIVAR